MNFPRATKLIFAVLPLTVAMACKTAARTAAVKEDPAPEAVAPPAAPPEAPEGETTEAAVPAGSPTVTSKFTPLDARGFPASLSQTGPAPVPQNAFEELDEIYGLMALAVVHADWQEQERPAKRGHNVGGILVNDKLEVVNWSRNSNDALCNGTQHGEVSLMLKHLNATAAMELGGFQIYTSLEPCMMCSGMMMQQNLLRTVYMQTDNAFGKNLERLSLDSRNAKVRFDGEPAPQNGFGPAPRGVISSMSPSEFRVELDKTFAAVGRGGVTAFLRTPAALDIYKRARAKFLNYPLKFGNVVPSVTIVPPGGKPVGLLGSGTNKALYDAAKAFFNDLNRGIIPVVKNEKGVLVEDTKNIATPRILENPDALVKFEKLPVAAPPATTPTVADGDVAVTGFDPATGFVTLSPVPPGPSTHVHQERIVRTCAN